jgi:hypothetical protein
MAAITGYVWMSRGAARYLFKIGITIIHPLPSRTARSLPYAALAANWALP